DAWALLVLVGNRSTGRSHYLFPTGGHMKSRHRVEGPLVEEIDDELADKWGQMIEQAEREIREIRVSMRWLKPEVDLIKRAAARAGIPYQTYVKQAAIHRALAELEVVAGV